MTSTTCHTLDFTTGRIRHTDRCPAVVDRHIYGDFDQVTGYRWDIPADVDPATARAVIGRHFDERLVTRAADWHHPQECQCRADYPDEPNPVAEQLTETWAAVAAELGAVNGPAKRLESLGEWFQRLHREATAECEAESELLGAIARLWFAPSPRNRHPDTEIDDYRVAEALGIERDAAARGIERACAIARRVWREDDGPRSI